MGHTRFAGTGSKLQGLCVQCTQFLCQRTPNYNAVSQLHQLTRFSVDICQSSSIMQPFDH